MDAIAHCRGCGSARIEPFFDLGAQPLANALVTDPGARDPLYPLSLSFCPDCSLVQLNHTADPREIFSHYVWVTGTSGGARVFAEEFCAALLSRADCRDGYVLEVASNDGTFLKPFLRRGVQGLGVDPAANIVEMAQADGVPSLTGFFGRDLASRIAAERGLPRVVFARNVLPHVAETHDFVAGLKVLAGETGLVAVEVHHARVILEELHYDSIYHEHLCYFTLHSLTRLLARHGLFAFDVLKSPISGGSLVVYARPFPLEKSAKLAAVEKEEEESGANRIESWRRFAELSRRHRELFLAILEGEAAAGRSVVGYGASARSSTMLNFCGVGPSLIRAIADQNPLKQGLYTPATHIPIQSPEEVLAGRPDTVAVLAWNFFDEIVAGLVSRFGFAGRVVKPLPHPPKALQVKEALHA
jgi:hypothetical protein